MLRPRRKSSSGILSVLLACSVVALGCQSEEPPTDPGNPSIGVQVSPSSVSVEQGSSTTVNVTVTGSGGFTGNATITVQNAPAGVSGTIGNVQSIDGTTTATVTIVVGSAVPPGSHTVILQASGSGVSAVTASVTLTVTPAPSYTLSTTPNQLTIQRGTQGSTDVSIARTNFTAEVTLALQGAPSGITASFDPNPAPAGSSTLTISVSGATAPGSYSLTIRGTATGLDDQTTMVDVSVPTPALIPDDIVFSRPGATGYSEIWVMDAQGQNQTQLTSFGWGATLGSPGTHRMEPESRFR